MNRRFLASCFSWLALVFSAAASSREAQWTRVSEAVEKGLPKTAIELLEPIIREATADKAYAEAVRAIGQKVALEAAIQGSKPEERIRRLQTATESAPAEMRPVLEALLAHSYWQYFQRNRWRIHQRSETGVENGPDVRTWDLARILAKIDRHFTAALADERRLKATPIAEFDDLLLDGTAPDAYRPTLFDFVAHEALRFYTAGEHGARRAENPFEIDAASPIFDDVQSFLRWQPEALDAGDPKLKAVRLYQTLLRFHETDQDPSAFLDLDLARLTFGWNSATGETKSERYESALRRFLDAHANHEIFARACSALASKLNAEDKPDEAHAIAQRGLDAYRDTPGGAMCFNLIQQIESKSIDVQTEQVWNSPWPTLNVTYRNLTRVHFRAIAADFDERVAVNRWAYGRVDRNDRERLLRQTPTFAWSADLPPTTDFRRRTERIPAPATLKPGFYYLFSSFDPSFGDSRNIVAATTVWVSDLALVLNVRGDGHAGTGLVLSAASGAPIAGAHVKIWAWDGHDAAIPQTPAVTDQDGRFELPSGEGQLAVLAEHGGHMISSAGPVFTSHSEPDHQGLRTVFFTDRAIYRPGQTIQYKGISMEYDHGSGVYAAHARRDVTVVFRDANSKEIARTTHQTNDYGSFNGVFTAPRDRATGYMTLLVDGPATGQTGVRVEEYKRPKFQVALQAPAQAPKLGETVNLTGKATAYTGAPISSAKVAWRVERVVRAPYWCWWWRPSSPQAIAHGNAITDADGVFKLSFPAQPDRSVPEKNEPTFEFAVFADVTDSTGETRSNQLPVRIGYAALQAVLTCSDWQSAGKPVSLEIATRSLDGVPQAASGSISVAPLNQPVHAQRSVLRPEHAFRWTVDEPPADPTNPDSWLPEKPVLEKPFSTDSSGKTHVEVPLAPGIYRVTVATHDRFGRPVTARTTTQVVDTQARRYGVKVPHHFEAASWTVQPGQTFTAVWGTGYETGRAFVEIECRGKRLNSYWTAPDTTQTLIEVPVTGALCGGFTVRLTYVRENRLYSEQRVVNVPWMDKQLSLRWEHFRSKLQPGQPETWTAVVTGPKASHTAAEMVATLYDASLDQFTARSWPQRLNVFRSEYAASRVLFGNAVRPFTHVLGGWWPESRTATWSYRAFPPEIISSAWNHVYKKSRVASGQVQEDGTIVLSPFAVAASEDTGYQAVNTLAGTRLRTQLQDVGTAISAVPAEGVVADEAPLAAAEPKPDLGQVSARKNLSETAFFLPTLVTGPDGTVRISFTAPEALTEWRFLGFAHDAQLRSGLLTDTAVTSKDLMVEPNPPRFLREGDTVEFTVKVTNRTDKDVRGAVRVTFADAATLDASDAALGNHTPEQSFHLGARQSRSFSWRISVPDGLGFLTYKAVASTGASSDGEEGWLPVLSRRILVTESLPLPIRGPGEKTFTFAKLQQSGGSSTLRHQSLTVEMTSQPAWYAVMALPYLMEFPHECNEQMFNRLYANALARHIAAPSPKIRRIFDLWKATPALDSPLEKNADLKSVALEETPWLRQAGNESEARRNLGLLLDANRLEGEVARLADVLAERQLGDGRWSWFPGGRPDDFITLYIVTGYGRLRHLGVSVDTAPAEKALGTLDAWMDENYRRIRKTMDPEKYVPGYIDALYLYGRSFFLRERPIAPEHRAAVDFLLGQSRKFWLDAGGRQSQAQLALALMRFGDTETPRAILRSLKERSVTDPELGMHWRDAEYGWWWYRAPIETQALMIEAFDEVAADAAAVEDCKVWLLKQKQTQDWKTTKATADAIYSLLLRGESLLSSDAVVKVSLGGKAVHPGKTEAGTGYYAQRFPASEVNAAMGRIVVTKPDAGVSWGGVHWQYLEDIGKVTPHEGTPLKLKKTLWLRKTTRKGPQLVPVSGAVAVGDELVVRLELRVDRDMEYVHLKDQRGSGTEPVNVLSGYRFQDGLAYYESTRDTASHFFIDYLPKGVHVLEYATRVQLRGHYQTGMAEIQCMYAPEFNSHSESRELTVE